MMNHHLAAIRGHLQQSIQHDSASHAYVFAGPAGAHTQQTAYWFAQQLLCSERTQGAACGVCTPCETLAHDNCPDLITIDTDKNIMSVDIVREQINRVAHITPLGRYKIFVVVGADRMNIQAQNALLKTLEEAPPQVKIILLATSKHSFLPTIVSRVVAIDFVEQSPELDPELVSYVGHFLSGLEQQTLAGVFRYCEKLTEQKEQIFSLLHIMQLYYRDLIVLKTTGTLQHPMLTLTYDESASAPSLQGLMTKFESVNFCIDALSKNANFQLAIETMLIKIRQAS